MCSTAERTYQGGTGAPAAARAFGHSLVMAALVPAGWQLADDVSVVISELVTRAVCAGASSMTVRVTVHYDHLDIRLTHDRDALLPAIGGPDAEQTRRTLLDRLTTWVHTTEPEAGRVVTEARIRCDPRHTGKLDCRLRPASRPA